MGQGVPEAKGLGREVKRVIVNYFEDHGLVMGVVWICLAASFVAATVKEIAR